MKEKIKNWWTKYVFNQYAIKRSGIVYWFIYKNGEKTIRKVSGQSEVLIALSKKSEPQFEKSISKAKLFRGFMAHYFLKKLRQRYKGKYTLELVNKNDLLFLTDITGLTGN